MLYTQGKTEITPAEAGYDASRLEALNTYFQRCIDDGVIHRAMYYLTRKGKVFAYNAVGRQAYNNDAPARPDSVRYIASKTKDFTATAILKLVEDGCTRIDVKVGDILLQFNTPLYNQITLYHLLTQTSGTHGDISCFETRIKPITGE